MVRVATVNVVILVEKFATWAVLGGIYSALMCQVVGWIASTDRDAGILGV